MEFLILFNQFSCLSSLVLLQMPTQEKAWKHLQSAFRLVQTSHETTEFLKDSETLVLDGDRRQCCNIHDSPSSSSQFSY